MHNINELNAAEPNITFVKERLPVNHKVFSIYEEEQEEFNIYKDENSFDDYNQLFDIEFGFY